MREYMKNKTKNEKMKKQMIEELMKNVIDTLIDTLNDTLIDTLIDTLNDTLIDIINLNIENLDGETITRISMICDSKRYSTETILSELNKFYFSRMEKLMKSWTLFQSRCSENHSHESFIFFIIFLFF